MATSGPESAGVGEGVVVGVGGGGVWVGIAVGVDVAGKGVDVSVGKGAGPSALLGADRHEAAPIVRTTTRARSKVVRKDGTCALPHGA
jgi:hypothetical protein